jgi:hypothetical protein
VSFHLKSIVVVTVLVSAGVASAQGPGTPVARPITQARVALAPPAPHVPPLAQASAKTGSAKATLVLPSRGPDSMKVTLRNGVDALPPKAYAAIAESARAKLVQLWEHLPAGSAAGMTLEVQSNGSYGNGYRTVYVQANGPRGSYLHSYFRVFPSGHVEEGLSNTQSGPASGWTYRGPDSR